MGPREQAELTRRHHEQLEVVIDGLRARYEVGRASPAVEGGLLTSALLTLVLLPARYLLYERLVTPPQAPPAS